MYPDPVFLLLVLAVAVLVWIWRRHRPRRHPGDVWWMPSWWEEKYPLSPERSEELRRLTYYGTCPVCASVCDGREVAVKGGGTITERFCPRCRQVLGHRF